MGDYSESVVVLLLSAVTFLSRNFRRVLCPTEMPLGYAITPHEGICITSMFYRKG